MGAGRKYTFSLVDLYFIQGHCNTMTPEVIAGHIGCNVDQVREKVAEFQKTKLPNAYEQMVRKNKQAVAMTGTASQIGDENRTKTVSKRIEECVHVIDQNRE